MIPEGPRTSHWLPQLRRGRSQQLGGTSSWPINFPASLPLETSVRQSTQPSPSTRGEGLTGSSSLWRTRTWLAVLPSSTLDYLSDWSETNCLHCTFLIACNFSPRIGRIVMIKMHPLGRYLMNIINPSQTPYSLAQNAHMIENIFDWHLKKKCYTTGILFGQYAKIYRAFCLRNIQVSILP